MRRILPFLLVFTLLSCKSKQKIIASQPVATGETATISNIIKNHYAIKRDFTTAYIKANIDYADNKQSLSLSADIRIKKDEIILVSVKFFGIVVAKAIITPTQVRYYEKAGGKYFEGDYKTLSNLLGTDLDFLKAQNMLLGQAIDDLYKGNYSLSIEEDSPKLEETTEENFNKTYLFDINSFWLKSQEITQKTPERKMRVNYSNYNSFPECVLPGELLIFANQDNKTTNITIEYKNATFNEDLTFPYSVPSGYEQIKL
ncbi:DUF4292 domain-containing protein [Flavobacterium psychrophilum]|jgi:hypothetical protein|uniref:DUF4292 domain-containing protein n=2 Tax=Flavobacterium psychrophilum TaxID=96345 RepID=A0A075RG65_FLAPS|nr:DUF4292 domain-containing protein [Flavobacterium psychrophilum]AIG31164.1 hypothetical protein IA03_12110 [Flavobacterium psychrophilum]AIG33441.1 hypothetical protein IA01_12140 [Flavobacterium psychrophilum]AIG35591.1 hypothetical protein IA02_11515 [Flavobacterium psychrophilum]AIG37952.1 hypothetical protein IA04_11995 [Flavobacterium psychrophilum]AIG40223.1 hypothetical protein IA05_12115 [Flavobacterium psychrophilum]